MDIVLYFYTCVCCWQSVDRLWLMMLPSWQPGSRLWDGMMIKTNDCTLFDTSVGDHMNQQLPVYFHIRCSGFGTAKSFSRRNASTWIRSMAKTLASWRFPTPLKLIMVNTNAPQKMPWVGRLSHLIWQVPAPATLR